MRDFTIEVDTPWMARILDPSEERRIELYDFNIVQIKVRHPKGVKNAQPWVTLTFQVGSVISPNAVITLNDKEETIVSLDGGIKMTNPAKNITEDLTEYVNMYDIKIVTTHSYDSALKETEEDPNRGTYLELDLYPKTVVDNRIGEKK